MPAALLPFACLLLTAAAVPQQQEPAAGHVPPAGMQRFVSRTRTFAIDLPADWRQLPPGKARELRPILPPDVAYTQPTMQYALGPVDLWLQGEFDGVHLWVVEQDQEWVTAGMDLAAELQARWATAGDVVGMDYVVSEVRRTKVGKDGQDAVECLRLATPRSGGRSFRSLDVSVPTGGRTVSLAFRSYADDFDRRLPWFRNLVSSLTFARKGAGERSLGDRLWTPILTGAIVGLVLALLYRRSRRRV